MEAPTTAKTAFYARLDLRLLARKTLLGALATGTLDDAATALNASLRAVKCSTGDSSAVGWRADVDGGSVVLCGWRRERAIRVECGEADVPTCHECALDAFAAVRLGARLLESVDVWSTEIPLHVAEAVS